MQEGKKFLYTRYSTIQYIYTNYIQVPMLEMLTVAATKLRPAPCAEGVPGAGARKVAAMVTASGMTATARSTSSYRLPLEMSFIVRHLCSWLQLDEKSSS